MKKYLYNYTSEENAYLVENYPWGFRLRTKIRYWIETSDKKNGGQRFCHQTLNPKNGLWCAPKKTTYTPILIMYLDENEHVKIASVDYNHFDEDKREEQFKDFMETHKDNLTAYQVKKLKEIKAYREVMKNVTWTIKESEPVDCSTFISNIEKELEEDKKNEKEQLKIYSKINRAINNLSKTIEL